MNQEGVDRRYGSADLEMPLPLLCMRPMAASLRAALRREESVRGSPACRAKRRFCRIGCAQGCAKLPAELPYRGGRGAAQAAV